MRGGRCGTGRVTVMAWRLPPPGRVGLPSGCGWLWSTARDAALPWSGDRRARRVAGSRVGRGRLRPGAPGWAVPGAQGPRGAHPAGPARAGRAGGRRAGAGAVGRAAGVGRQDGARARVPDPDGAASGAASPMRVVTVGGGAYRLVADTDVRAVERWRLEARRLGAGEVGPPRSRCSAGRATPGGGRRRCRPPRPAPPCSSAGSASAGSWSPSTCAPSSAATTPRPPWASSRG